MGASSRIPPSYARETISCTDSDFLLRFPAEKSTLPHPLSNAAVMSLLLQDLRYALRGLRRVPGFALVAILTLALGIGANTAIFSIVNGVILRPLGYPKPEQLMYLTTQFPAFGFDQFWVSPPEYFEFRELNRSFASVGAYTTGEANLTAGDRPLRVRSASVDDGLLTTLGIQPIAGRLFSKGEADLTG